MTKIKVMHTEPLIEIAGHETMAEEIAKSMISEKSTKIKVDELRGELQPVILSERLAKEKRGHFSKRVLVFGQKHNLSFGLKNSFSPLDLDDEFRLRSTLGETFDSLYHVEKKVKLKPKMVGELIKLLGDRADEFLEMGDVSTTQPDFLETRASLRPKLTDEQNQTLDEVVEKTMHQPTLQVK